MGNAVFVTMASVSLNINYLFFAHEHYEDHIWGQTERTAQHTVVFCSGAIPNRILAWNLTPALLPESHPSLAVCCSLGVLTVAARVRSHTFGSQSEMSPLLFCPLLAYEP